jgi:hydrogenase maturation factor
MMLPAGKLPADLLAQLLQELPTQAPDLVVGPAVGEDAAVIDFTTGADRLLVAKSDPITFATDEIGYYAVNVCANDLAVMGATPRFYLPTILFPAGQTTATLVQEIFQQIGMACRQLGLTIAGGHSEITPAVNQPVVAGTMLGHAPRQRIIQTSGARPGDAVLLAGSVPVEGTSIIAREMRATLLARGWSEGDLATAAHYLHDPGISVLTPARIAVELGAVTAMHDPTEGGVITGLRELAIAANVGLVVDLDAIPVPELSARLCAEFGLDPLGTIASGALLATVPLDAADALCQQWRKQGWSGAVIGRVVAKAQGLVATRAARYVEFPQFAVDEITKLWS